MKLRPRPFACIARGEKWIELRLYDEKRREIRVGDDILFRQTETGETLRRRVDDIRTFPDFFKLYQYCDTGGMGYCDGEVARAEDMHAYYSRDEIEKYGVVAIYLKEI